MFARIVAILAAVAMIGGMVPMSVGDALAQPQKASREQIARAEVLNAQAKALFKQKQFADAAKLFLDAYQISGESAQLFNAARSSQEAGLLIEAKELFLLYKKKSADKTGLLDADRQLAKIDDKLGSNAIKPPPVVVVQQVPEPTASTPTQYAGGATDQTGLDIVQDATPTAPRGLTMGKLQNWRSGGALACVAAGIGLMLVGRSMGVSANERQIASQADIEAYQSDFSTGNTLWITGLIVAVAGGGGLGTWSVIEASK